MLRFFEKQNVTIRGIFQVTTVYIPPEKFCVTHKKRRQSDTYLWLNKYELRNRFFGNSAKSDHIRKRIYIFTLTKKRNAPNLAIIDFWKKNFERRLLKEDFWKKNYREISTKKTVRKFYQNRNFRRNNRTACVCFWIFVVSSAPFCSDASITINFTKDFRRFLLFRKFLT